ncbi:hypothetical protein DIE14_08020 [Burkholderia sp. Bp9017]|nr:hypothetical protein DIE14_08020 [Burkholderia sp. Bp9017]
MSNGEQCDPTTRTVVRRCIGAMGIALKSSDELHRVWIPTVSNLTACLANARAFDISVSAIARPHAKIDR